MSAHGSMHKVLDGPEGLVSRFGGTDALLIRDCIRPEDFVSRDQISSLLRRGLLRWPYFSVLKDGVKPPLSELTESRRILGRSRAGYASDAKITKHLDDGATLKLIQIEDWHRGTRDCLRTLESALPVEAKAFIFLTPEDNTGMLPHRDGSHVLVMQLEGRKEWRLYDPGAVSKSTSGLDVDVTAPPRVELLHPGDVLYLPHGYPHAATAVDGWSLHLTFTLAEPTPEALVHAMVDRWRASPAGAGVLARGAHSTPEQKVREISQSLMVALNGTEDAVIIQSALATMRAKVGPESHTALPPMH